MEETKLEELIRTMEASAARQKAYAKKQCLFTGIAAACCVVMLCLAVFLAGFVMQKAGDLTAILENVQSVTDVLLEDLEAVPPVLENLKTVTDELAAADLDGMIDHVDSLATSSEKGIAEAMDKLSIIDFETLNQAIEDLADVVEPLAKFFQVFQ